VAGEVTYEVTGSGSANTITFGRGSAVSQTTGAQLPWKQTGPGGQKGDEYSLSAQNGEDADGEISCRISIEGAVIAENKAEGEHAAVACSARR